MSDPMRLFRVDIAVENPSRPGERAAVPSVLVDTGAELSRIPAQVLDRRRGTRPSRGEDQLPHGTPRTVAAPPPL